MNIDCLGRLVLGNPEELKESIIRDVKGRVRRITRENNLCRNYVESLMIKINRLCGVMGVELKTFEEGEQELIRNLYNEGLVGLTPENKVCLDRSALLYLGR